MWKTLLLKYNIQLPRHTVQILLHELDPEVSDLRRAQRLRRRMFVHPGPNVCWHSDGYDKLKPNGFPIHDCVDGFSRRVLSLFSNEDQQWPSNYRKVLCARKRRMPETRSHRSRDGKRSPGYTSQCLLRRNGNYSLPDFHAHRYGSSHSNQRIEAWLSFFRRPLSNW